MGSNNSVFIGMGVVVRKCKLARGKAPGAIYLEFKQ